MKPRTTDDLIQRELAKARVWSYFTAAMTLACLVLCAIEYATRKPGDDWVAVILFGALAGLAAFFTLVLEFMHFRIRQHYNSYRAH